MQETILISLPLPQLQTLIIDCVNACLDVRKDQTRQSEADQLLTVQQAAEFLTLSVPTIYGLISKGAIPCMKRSKRVYFSKTELIHYLKQGKKKTVSEIEAETDAYLSRHKKKEVRNA